VRRAIDVVVVGAGPYGLSTAAHLLGRGLRVAVFGRPLGMWREHMPQGMLLRSHWWASNLSDPRRDHGFAQFAKESGQDTRYPVPIQTFIDYGLWFQQRAVPHVDETYVASIERRGARFVTHLVDGRQVESRAVVMAIGPYPFANRPAQFTELPAGFVSHSSDHRDFSRFKGRDVIVIGGGQSAIEFAALLHEAGAAVQVVSRRSIKWLEPDRSNTRSTLERILAPDASIAPGWINWVWDHVPYLFYRFPQRWKDAYTALYASGATDWLRDRVLGKVTLRERQTVVNVTVAQGKLDLAVSDGVKLCADHVILATGYTVNVDQVTMFHPSLRAEIATHRGSPMLNHWFESSVPGLYFIGLASLRVFGPLYRFVAGCGAAAWRVASAITRGGVGRPQAAPTRYRAAANTPVVHPRHPEPEHA
jgi:cation diffusion facilitator CzcD-associated flavoprotein CzcO